MGVLDRTSESRRWVIQHAVFQYQTINSRVGESAVRTGCVERKEMGSI